MVSFRKQSNIFIFTATNLNWLKILDNNDHKQIVLNSLKFLHEENRATIFAFVIMPNHIHLILRIEDGHKKHEIQRDFLKYTSQQIKFNLIKIDSPLLDDILVNDKDRKYQIWERNPLWFELDNTDTLIQKLNYIHNNPIKKDWFEGTSPEDYLYSSAKYYISGEDPFNFLTHYLDYM